MSAEKAVKCALTITARQTKKNNDELTETRWVLAGLLFALA